MNTTIAVLVGVVVVVVALLVGTMLVRRGRSAGSPTGAGKTSSAAGTQIAIQDFAFAPASVTVPAGTTITWTNHDVVHHTVTFRNGMADSGELGQGETFRFAFATPGSFDYYCRIHPDMTAAVVVSG